jgi:hypothetical protein
MQRTFLAIIISIFYGCASPVQYSWQDIRQPPRDDATVDLEECRTYTAKQYKPGMPAGESYLRDTGASPITDTGTRQGEWRPYRSPFPTTNVNSLPVHDVPVDYTGYPGELDYYPDYLDDIMEKCMFDRGWSYKPVSKGG